MTLHSQELQSRIYKLIEYELEEALEAICSNLFHFQMKSRALKRLVSKFLQKVQCKDTTRPYVPPPPLPLYPQISPYITQAWQCM